MIYSRILIGLAAAATLAGPLVALGQLRYDNEIHDFRKSFYAGESDFPIETKVFLPLAPLDWWSFLSPIAIGIAVAAALRSQWSIRVGAVLLVLSFVLLLAYRAAFVPYAKLMQVVGVLPPSPYPPEQFVANVSLVGVSFGVAIFSVTRAVIHRRASMQPTIGEQDSGGDP